MKGKILEEIVQRYLEQQGYERLNSQGSGTPKIEGRGTTHQIDAFGTYKRSIPFVYPIRLLAEAKCYDSKAVGVDIIREAITVKKDISEYYEGHSDFDLTDRRLESVALFSTSGYSPSARELAFAHGVYLVDMGMVRPHIDNIIDKYDPDTHKEVEKSVRRYFRDQTQKRVYFGNYTGQYPVTITSRPFPSAAIAQTDRYVVQASPAEEEVTGARRFRLSHEEFDWTGTVEVPILFLDQTSFSEQSIIVPIQIDDIFRRIRVELRNK